jgi:hypothetical protein
MLVPWMLGLDRVHCSTWLYTVKYVIWQILIGQYKQTLQDKINTGLNLGTYINNSTFHIMINLTKNKCFLYLFFYIYFIGHSLISIKQHPVWDNIRWPYIHIWPSNHIRQFNILTNRTTLGVYSVLKSMPRYELWHDNKWDVVKC